MSLRLVSLGCRFFCRHERHSDDFDRSHEVLSKRNDGLNVHRQMCECFSSSPSSFGKVRKLAQTQRALKSLWGFLVSPKTSTNFDVRIETIVLNASIFCSLLIPKSFSHTNDAPTTSVTLVNGLFLGFWCRWRHAALAG